MLRNFKGKNNTQGFDKSPENINRRGKPRRKGFAHVNKLLEEKGFEKVKKQDYLDFISLLMNCTEAELKKLLVDKTLPMFLRIMVQDMNNKTTRTAIIKDLRDFIFGKASDNMNIEVSAKARVISREEIQKYAREYYSNFLVNAPDEKLSEEWRIYKKLEIEMVSKDESAKSEFSKNWEDSY